MLCRRCEVALPRAAWRGALPPGRVWGTERLQDLLCSSCGTILAGEDIAHRLLQKQSQLARFGLDAPGPLLLEAASPKER
jgi:hypothetical protein